MNQLSETSKISTTRIGKRLTIAVDIDGTITIDADGWDYENRIPNKKYIAEINKLYDEGHFIYFFSARHVEDMEVTYKWLTENGVKFHEIILGKPHYDCILDDKASRTIEQLREDVVNLLSDE